MWKGHQNNYNGHFFIFVPFAPSYATLIIKNNPLIEDNDIITNYQNFLRLIQLLNKAEDVQIVEKEIDVGCMCSCSDPIVMIDKYMLLKIMKLMYSSNHLLV